MSETVSLRLFARWLWHVAWCGTCRYATSKNECLPGRALLDGGCAPKAQT